MALVNLEGMALADGVVETIVAIALKDVEGVSLVGGVNPAGILGTLSAKPATAGIQVDASENNTLHVGVHIEALYGYALPEIASRVRSAIADAVLTQVGVEVSAVDVYIDSIQF